MKKLIAGLLLALLLAGGQAFADNVTGTVGGSNSGTLQVGVNVTTNVTLQERAYNMLIILERVANYTTILIDNSGTVDNETLSLYAQAENLRGSAWAAYNAGNYSEAITAAMSAMETYELVIERMTPSSGMQQMNPSANMNSQALYWASIELQRAKEYLAYAAEIIDEASGLGIDTSQASELYDQTVEAYTRVEVDIKNGDVSNLRNDMRVAENLRMRLEMAVEGLVRGILSANAGDIAETFTKKLEVELNRTAELMTLMESVMGNSSADDPRASMMLRMIEMRKAELQNMLAMVQRLIDSGRYEMALRMVKEINLELEEAISEIGQAAMEFQNSYMMDYCGQYANTTTQPMSPDYQKYCNQSWWGQWEREMDDMMGTGWWNEETDHMGAGMGMNQNGSWNGMGMDNMGGWNGPWWSDDEEGMNWRAPGNGSMGGGWISQEDSHRGNGTRYGMVYDDWSENWMGTNNGNWTMNQTNSTETSNETTEGNAMQDGDQMEDSNQDSGAGDMSNNMGDGSDDQNNMTDSGDGSGGSGNDDQDNDDSGGSSGSWNGWWGG
ncbi:hypothetical protein [Palaeococcus ferrophilus]|uniref:hypothetical protein n=1 Tax=Palaeococcus ferrophilus TaxID=83868 RepID=UPI0012FBB4E0|nr:hypothetical protein [Palaeococcus ferrophilus]